LQRAGGLRVRPVAAPRPDAGGVEREGRIMRRVVCHADGTTAFRARRRGPPGRWAIVPASQAMDPR
jgi:hypothetical protein